MQTNSILLMKARQSPLIKFDPKKEERIKTFRLQNCPNFQMIGRPNTYSSNVIEEPNNNNFQAPIKQNNNKSLKNSSALPSLHQSCKPSKLPSPMPSYLQPIRNSYTNPFFDNLDEKTMDDPDCF